MKERLASLIALLIAWEMVAWLFRSMFMPPLWKIGLATWQAMLSPLYWGHIGHSMFRWSLGLVLGVPAGFAVGMLCALSESWRRLASPVVDGLQTVPKAAILPLFIVWFGIGQTPKVLLVAMAVFFPVAIATATALRYTPEEILLAATSSGLKAGQILRYVRLPLALPHVFAAIRLGAGYGFLALATAELLATSEGLGYLVYDRAYSFDIAGSLVAVMTLSGLNVACCTGLRQIEARSVPWYHLETDHAHPQ